MMGDMRAAAGLAVAGSFILALREPLHGWVEKLTWPELRSALVLLAMTFIALPIIPNAPIGPFGGVNLREVWVIAIVLAGASFVGYVAVKYFGASHGVLLAGAAGGTRVINRCDHHQRATCGIAGRFAASPRRRCGNG